MKIWILGFALIHILFLFGCTETNSEETRTHEEQITSTSNLPPQFIKGEELFHARCAACHGEKAKGTDKGPSFISKIYEPNHHGDASFHLAVRNGVRAHHWKFGDMPKLPGVPQEEVTHIIGYVRWLQKQAGIF
ncbi:MAG TPA: cytochrome c [Nitrospiria bacterium]|jgi:cytochrome c2